MGHAAARSLGSLFECHFLGKVNLQRFDRLDMPMYRNVVAILLTAEHSV
jgi:hypothetical protein